MGKAIKNLTSALLLGAVFLSSCGIPYFSHFCRINGKGGITISAGKTCCPNSCRDHDDAGFSRRSCCDDKSFFLRKELPGLRKTKIAVPILAFIRTLPLHEAEKRLACQYAFPAYIHPPPISGQILLLSLGIQRA